MNAELIGISAGVISCMTFLPQVIKTCRTRSTADISLAMFLLATAGTSLWLAYGIMIHSFSIIFANCVVLALSVIMLLLFYLFSTQKKIQNYGKS